MTDDPTPEFELPEGYEVKAFDPVHAYIEIIGKLMNLISAVHQAPDVLPPREVLRAAQVCVDQLEAIREFTMGGLMSQLREVVSGEDWSDHNIENDALKASLSEDERELAKMEIIRKLATPFSDLEH